MFCLNSRIRSPNAFIRKSSAYPRAYLLRSRWFWRATERRGVSKSERELVEVVYWKLASAGLRVLKNIFVLGFEVDIIALDVRSSERPTVYVVEVKRKVKSKLIKQLRKRMPYADYVYAAVPLAAALRALRRIPAPFGVMLIDLGSSMGVYVVREASYLGNGVEMLNALKNLYRVSMRGSRPRHSAAVSTTTPSSRAL